MDENGSSDKNSTKIPYRHSQEQIWDFYCQLAEESKLFNQVQEKYRTMASTWILGTFAAFGFLFTSSLSHDLIHLMIGCVGLISAIGLIILWSIDVHFYQNLISASYNEMRAIEQVHDWVPQVRENIRYIMKGKGRIILSSFYMISVTIIYTISLFGWWIYLDSMCSCRKVLIMLVISTGLLLVFSTMVRSKNKHIEKTNKLVDKRKRSYEKYKETI